MLYLYWLHPLAGAHTIQYRSVDLASIMWFSGWSLSLEEGCMVNGYSVMGLYSRSFWQNNSLKRFRRHLIYIYIPQDVT